MFRASRCLLASLLILSLYKIQLDRPLVHAAAQEDAPLPQARRRLLPVNNASAGPPPVVLVLGLPRSGSQPIHDYFTCNGLASAHYCCDGDNGNRTRFPCRSTTCGQCVHANLRQGRPPFQNCSSNRDTEPIRVWSRFDVESQDPFAWFLPQHFALAALQRHHPDAVWVLNRRAAPRRWAANVLHWHADTHRLLAAFGVPYYSARQARVVSYHNFTAAMAPDLRAANWSADQVYQELQRSLARAGDVTEYQRRLKALEDVYERHTRAVQEAAAHFKKPPGTLVTLDVDDPAAGQVLAAAFPGTRADCWSFNSDELDNDWQDFTFKL